MDDEDNEILGDHQTPGGAQDNERDDGPNELNSYNSMLDTRLRQMRAQLDQARREYQDLNPRRHAPSKVEDNLPDLPPPPFDVKAGYVANPQPPPTNATAGHRSTADVLTRDAKINKLADSILNGSFGVSGPTSMATILENPSSRRRRRRNSAEAIIPPPSIESIMFQEAPMSAPPPLDLHTRSMIGGSRRRKSAGLGAMWRYQSRPGACGPHESISTGHAFRSKRSFSSPNLGFVGGIVQLGGSAGMHLVPTLIGMRRDAPHNGTAQPKLNESGSF